MKKKTSKYGPCPFCGRKTTFATEFEGTYFRCCSDVFECGAATGGRDQKEANQHWMQRVNSINKRSKSKE